MKKIIKFIVDAFNEGKREPHQEDYWNSWNF